jgi:EVE domain
MNSWLFQGSPQFYRVRPALRHFKATSQLTTWLVNTHKTEIRAGDEVFFWEAGSQAGLVGWGEIQTDPAKIALEEEELQFVIVRAKFDGARPRRG